MGIWEHTEPEYMRLAWGRWYDWAIRSKLEPVKGAARMIKGHLDGIILAAARKITNASAEDQLGDPEAQVHGARIPEPRTIPGCDLLSPRRPLTISGWGRTIRGGFPLETRKSQSY
ncbi:MAG: transposase [Nannocystaceae bacterium]